MTIADMPPVLESPADAPPAPDALRDALDVSLRAGQIMLENGASTARVEETVARLGAALGVEWLEVFATPTGIFASAGARGDHRTRILRITSASVELSKVAAAMDISRAAAAGLIGRAHVGPALDYVARQPRLYGPVATVLAVALGCACFALQGGGGLWEFLITLAAAGAGQALRGALHRGGLGRALATGLVAFLTSWLALLLTQLLTGLAPQIAQAAPLLPPAMPSPEITVASAVLMLLPGAVMMSATADIFQGDTVSGTARAVTALMTLGAIAAGTWAALLAGGAPLDVSVAVQPNLALALGGSLAGAAGFGVLFDVPRRALLPASAVGALSVAAHGAALGAGLPALVAMFAAGLAIGAAAELLARLMRMPAMIFSTPGFVPLVPGTLAFITMLAFARGDTPLGLERLVSATVLTAALATGIGVAGALARLRRPGV